MQDYQAYSSYDFANAGTTPATPPHSGGSWIENASSEAESLAAGAYLGASMLSNNMVESTFYVADGVGMFVSSNSTVTEAVRFRIKYFGDETLLSLDLIGASIPLKSNAMAYNSEIAMPTELMARGQVVTMRLAQSTWGWRVTLKIGSTWRTILDLRYRGTASVNASVYADASSARRSGSSYAGIIAYAAGVKFKSFALYFSGKRGNVMGQNHTYFQDLFSGAAGEWVPTSSNTGTPTTAYAVTTGNLSGTGNFAKDGSGNLELKVTTPALAFLNLGTAPHEAGDFPLHMVKFAYDSGQVALKITVGGVSRNIYINSDVASPATFSGVTIEAGGP